MLTVFAGFAAAVALSAGSAGTEVVQAKSLASQSPAAKTLYVCERDAASKRTFKRLHGEVRFVTAKSLLERRGDGDQWTAPRCITGAELRRLESSSGNLVQIRHQTR